MTDCYHDVQVGDEVLVRSGFGNGPLHRGTVIAVLADVKDGYPGIDYKLANNEQFWAYSEQIQGITRKAAG